MTLIVTFALDLNMEQGHICHDLLLPQGQGQRSRFGSLPSKIVQTFPVRTKCFHFLCSWQSMSYSRIINLLIKYHMLYKYFQITQNVFFWILDGSMINLKQTMNFYHTKKHSCQQEVDKALVASNWTNQQMMRALVHSNKFLLQWSSLFRIHWVSYL